MAHLMTKGTYPSVSPRIAREQARLHQRQQTQRHRLREQWMGELFLLALLIRNHHRFARIAFEEHGAALAFGEIVGADLSSIDESERQSVGQGPEFLHQVERERRAPRPQRMQETDLRVESRPFQRRATIVHPHGVEEGKESVEAIARRAARAAVHPKVLSRIGTHQERDAGKVLPRGFALDAAHRVEVARRGQGTQRGSEIVGAAGELCSLVFALGLPRTAQQHLSRVLYLPGDAAASSIERECAVHRAFVLRRRSSTLPDTGPSMRALKRPWPSSSTRLTPSSASRCTSGVDRPTLPRQTTGPM
jgi:hypothetical protein